MEVVKFKLRFTCCLGVDCEGRGGGLALLWDDNTDLILRNFLKSHIHAKIRKENLSWFFKGLYGHPVPTCRRETWNLLKILRPGEGHQWLVGGDFNELLSNAEKWGGNPRVENQMERFRHTLDECQPQDLGFSSNPYTWCNGREEDERISERLDRFVANKEWQSQFQNWHVHHRTNVYSDHSPILLYTTSKTEEKRRKRVFLFEAMWTDAP